MIGGYFNNNSMKRYVKAFGSLFTDIEVHRKNSDDTKIEKIKVPISFGSRQRYDIMEKDRNTKREERKVSSVLPRMYYELNSIVPDDERKTSKHNKLKACVVDTENGTRKWTYQPVPYDFNFRLGIKTKNLDDMYQIVQQILPFFTPSITVTMKGDFPEDVKIFLLDTEITDNWDTDIDERRVIEWFIEFKLQGNMFNRTIESPIIMNIGINHSDEVILNGSVDLSDFTKCDITFGAGDGSDIESVEYLVGTSSIIEDDI